MLNSVACEAAIGPASAQGTSAGSRNLLDHSGRATRGRRGLNSRWPENRPTPRDHGHAWRSPCWSRSRPRSGARRRRTGTCALFGDPARLLGLQRPDRDPDQSQLKISGSFLALVLAMVFLGGTPAALIGVITILAGWLRWRDEPHDLLNNLAHLRDLPAGRRASPSTRSIERSRRHPGRPGLLPARLRASSCSPWRSTSSMIAGYTCYLERSSLPRQGPHGAAAGAALRARRRADGRRRRLHLPPDRDRRRSPSSASSWSPSSTCSAPCCSPSSGPRSWSSAASSWPASRSGC